ncbi:hypothetical protein SNEBB_002523 [Seison nebaliae]|nr:hypothetical protein SNEBB_002523 [Seison nebaliae]
MSVIKNIMKSVNDCGGWMKSMGLLYRMDNVRDGECIGVDVYGNRYFHNPRHFIGKSRWIQYANKYGLDFDGSQIPPEWHAWLHYMTDKNPSTHPVEHKKFFLPHDENLTGSYRQYVPYSTTEQKVKVWQPK